MTSIRVRVAFALAVSCVAGSLWAASPLTFEERVEAQEAIERVYYAHRIWPRENPDPKPPFETQISLDQIEARVTDYLKKGAALEQIWGRPITPDALQAELDRLGRSTRDPALLSDLFRALDDDALRVAECLARPTLADRLVRGAYEAEETGRLASSFEAWWAEVSPGLHGAAAAPGGSGEFSFRLPPLPDRPEACAGAWRTNAFNTVLDPRYMHTAVWTGSEMIVWGGFTCFGYMCSPTTDTCLATGGRYTPATDTWLPTSTGTDCPSARVWHTAVWTGTEMVIWGGQGPADVNTGGRYNPLTDVWRPTSTVGACPPATMEHLAVWSGSRMVVWDSMNLRGGRYDPVGDVWQTMSAAGCPTARYRPAAVWTGSLMVLWSGWDQNQSGDAGYVNTGGRYDPVTDTWTATSTSGACPVGRNGPTAVWTGDEMVVWGGDRPSSGLYYSSGGRYNPASDTWVATPTASPCPSGRSGHSALWTGTDMVVWGGFSGSVSESTGARFSPTSNTWTSLPTSGAPSPRSSHSAVWTGAEMVVWGGWNASTQEPLGTGGRYRPSAGTWAAVSDWTGFPLGRSEHTAVWTGSEMIVWGGNSKRNSYLNTGYRYDPALDHWTSISSGTGCPSGREYHSAIWTGSEMIVWGGTRWDLSTGDVRLSSGGRYNPTGNTWTATSAGAGCPSGRSQHTAVWTGTTMIVWGGDLSEITGGRYNPASNTWMSTSTGTGCPTPRTGYSAVWTGSKMILWGGYNYPTFFNTGSRYDPATDTWAPTSTGTNCPTGRTDHAAVWTGSRMVVWGGSANPGGRYDPATDTWLPTSAAAPCPTVRSNLPSVWTGEEFILWGGWSSGGNLRDGARYDPTADSWIALPTEAPSPQARYGHTAVWTGTAMLVWGGNTKAIAGATYSPSGSSSPSVSGSVDGCQGVGTLLSTQTYSAYQWRLDDVDISGATAQQYLALTSGDYSVRITDASGCTASSPARSVSIWTNPTPSVTGPTNGCAPVLATQAAASYQWSLDGAVIPGATAQSWTALQSGDYSVAVTDSHGCQGVSAPVSVTVLPSPVPTVVGPSPACSSATLSTQAFASYQWLKDGTPLGGATGQSYLASAPGAYSVQVSAANGCGGTSAPFLVGAPPSPVITGPTSNTCPSPTVPLSATSGFAACQWRFGGTPIPGATSSTYDASLAGSYSVTVRDAAGCEGTSAVKSVSLVFCPKTEVSPAGGVFATRLVKDSASPTGYWIYFQKAANATGYNVYEGSTGSWYSHANAPGNLCRPAFTDLGTGEIRVAVTPSAGDHYYLVTAYRPANEGVSGYDSAGVEIPQSQSTCTP